MEALWAISTLAHQFILLHARLVRGTAMACQLTASIDRQDHLETQRIFAKSVRVCGAPRAGVGKAFCASLTDPW
jgi:hypothetical protein